MYLHQEKYFHLQLCPENVSLDAFGNAKLSNFASFESISAMRLFYEKTTRKYFDKNVLKFLDAAKQNTEMFSALAASADVFSFGVPFSLSIFFFVITFIRQLIIIIVGFIG